MTTHYAFDTDTASARVGDHEYGLELSDRWSTLGGTLNGGYLLAAALQALRDEFPQPDLLSASAHFLRPGTPGPARIHTDIARIGPRTATGQAILTRDEREVIRVLATFTDLTNAEGPTLVRNEPPALPAPDQCHDPLSGGTPGGAKIAERVQFRMPELAGFWRGEPGGTSASEFWMRFSDGRDADPIALALLVDAAMPVVFDLGVPGSSTEKLSKGSTGVS